MLRDLDSPTDAVNLQAPAEAAADQVIVDHDLVQRQAGGLGGRRLDSRQELRADPDLAAILAYMGRAVHQFHRRVREERNLIGRLEPRDGARHRLADIADRPRYRPRTEPRL